ncbi:MAG TPA: ester cyclase [Candidatus Acidoferrum sp.]
MPTTNKDVIERLYREVWNGRKLGLIDQLFSKSHALDDPSVSGAAVGPAVYRSQVQLFLDGFPDLRFTVNETISEKGKIVAVWTVTGTHQGEFLGLAPSNKKMSIDGITVHEVADGKILESHVVWDALGLFDQLGIDTPFKARKHAASSR